MKTTSKAIFVSIFVLASVYFIFACLSLTLAHNNTNASPVWPPTGIALAAVLMVGYRITPGIFIGAFLANIFALNGTGLSLTALIVNSSVTALGNTLEAFVGVSMIRRFIGDDYPFENIRNIVIFIAFGALLSTLVSATIGAVGFCAAVGDWALFGSLWITRWLGHATGAILFAAPFISLPRKNLYKHRFGKTTELLLIFLLLGIISVVVYDYNHPVKFLITPVLLWAILRFSLFETSLSIVFVDAIALLCTIRISNALSGEALNETLLFIQSSLGIISVTALFLSVVVDEQRRSKKALLAEKAFNDTILDSIPGAFYVLDTEGRLVRWNRFLEEIHNLSSEEIRGMDSMKNIHQKDKGLISEKTREAFEQGESIAEGRIITKDGDRYFLFTGRRIDINGSPYVVGTGIDITENKSAQQSLEEYRRSLEEIVKERTEQLTKANEALLSEIRDRLNIERDLTESEKKYRDLVEGANSVILRWTKGGIITFINKFAQQFFGYKEDEILGKNIMGTIVPSTETTGRDLSTLINSILDDPKAYAVNENENIKKNGERVWIAWTNTPIFDKDGHVIEVLSVGNDITRRKVAEDRLKSILEELEISKERAEASDRLKSAFLATMSHELRTPLNSIIGFTGIILQGYVGPLNDEQKKQLNMVKNSANHLLSLINDVLDISKIEAGQLQVSLMPFNLRSLIEQSVESSRPAADKKGLSLSVRISQDVDMIVSDYRRVEQILLNLLSNAIKFTEHGEVGVDCCKTDGFVRISVRDSGIGIKEDDMDKLFKAFQQVDSGITRRYEGTGLGLHICKKLTELLNGKIWASSVWGSGSTFFFTLPYEKGAPWDEKS